MKVVQILFYLLSVTVCLAVPESASVTPLDRNGSALSQALRETLSGKLTILLSPTNRLTIDSGLQKIVEAVIESTAAKLHPRKIIVLLANPKTGEILAMATQLESQAFNPAISWMYEPGSTAKPVVATAALSEGLLGSKSVINCENGQYPLGGKVIKDSKALGNQTPVEILAKSSNIGAVKMGQLLADDDFNNWIHRFGFGEVTGIPLQYESPGLINPPAKWDALTKARMSFGQSMAVTPIQMLMAYGAIANDGKYVFPGLVLASPSQHPPRAVMTKKTASLIKQALDVRPNHYLGAGHPHADAGMFHFSALGVDWFMQSPLQQEYAGKYFNLVQVDGESTPTNIPGGPNGYNGAATYLGSKFAASASVGAADLTYAYSWRWNTQPPQVWSDELKAMPWELEPSPMNMKIFAGTARYKLRPWCANYTYGNYIPTSRAPFNPMQYVFRSVGLVKGAHPYGFVVDDLKKDDADHLYQWFGMLNGGVWQADVPGLPSNMLALASSGVDPKMTENASKPTLAPKPGDPLLLVCALGMDGSGDPQTPLFEVKRIEGPKDRNGKMQYFDRLTINQKAKSVAYRILLLPFKSGEPLPKIVYDAARQRAALQWDGQTDAIQFTADAGNRSLVEIHRGAELLVKQYSGNEKE